MTKRHLIKTALLAGLGVLIPFSAKAETINLADWDSFHMGSYRINIAYVGRRDVFVHVLKGCLAESSNPFQWSLSKRNGQTRTLNLEEVKILWRFDPFLSDFYWAGNCLIVKAKMHQADHLVMNGDENEIL